MAISAKATGRRRDDTFSTRYDTGGLYELVAAVARVADPAYPDRITQRAFDDARASAGHPDASSARAICMRLGTSWPELLALVFDPDRSPVMQDVVRDRAGYRIPTEEEIFFALRFVMMKSGMKTTTYEQYQHHRERLIGEDRARYGGRSFLEQVLPRATQIYNAVGRDWQFALAIAQLPTFKPPKHRRRYELDEMYDAFVRATGARPQGWRTLERFAARAGVPFIGKLERARFASEEQTIIRQWHKAGLPVPERVMNMGEAKHLPLPDDLFPDRDERQRRIDRINPNWTYESVLAALAAYP